MLIAALFTIARTLTEKQIKLWYTYTVEYYSAMKRNEIGSFVVMWMELQSVIYKLVRERNKYHRLVHMYGI